MNKLTIVVTFAMLALGAAGLLVTAPKAVIASGQLAPISPMDMMRNAGDLPVQIVDYAV